MILKIILKEDDQYQQLFEKTAADLKQKLRLSNRDSFEINLILDEICTNIFENNPNIDNLSVTIEIHGNSQEINMLFIDNGTMFDPTCFSEPDIRQPLEKRQPGGLGLLLVKRYSNMISYERQNDLNRTTVTKSLGAKL